MNKYGHDDTDTFITVSCPACGHEQNVDHEEEQP